MPKKIGETIKYYRYKKDYTQEELAEKSGLSVATIRRIESGATPPSKKTLCKIENGLQLEEGTLVKK